MIGVEYRDDDLCATQNVVQLAVALVALSRLREQEMRFVDEDDISFVLVFGVVFLGLVGDNVGEDLF